MQYRKPSLSHREEDEVWKIVGKFTPGSSEPGHFITYFHKTNNMEVPVGTIIAYGGEVNENTNNYLLCDGKEYTRDQYPELFTAIGKAWGSSGDGRFNVPNLQGMFLRGVNGNRTDGFKDPDVGKRDPSMPGGNPTNNVGSVQLCAISSHNHTLSGENDANCQYAPSLTGGNLNPGRTWEIHGRGQAPGITDASVGNETRPNNAYVYWLIKAK
jgi:microcystin-dependent protein